MSPPISKDWWLAAALSSATLPAAFAQQPAATGAGPQAGVATSAVVQGAQRGASSAPIYVDGASGQRLTTGPNQSVHVLFSDQSAMTVGPNSDVVISEYQYDSQAKSGRLLVRMTKGLLRVVGGLISKKSETAVVTPTSTIGIRGGITLVQVDEQGTNATFLFGQSMRMTGGNGSTETVTRPGFGTSSSSAGVTPPQRTPTERLDTLLALFEAGQPRPPVGGPPALTNNAVQQVGDVAPDRLRTRITAGDEPGLPFGKVEPPQLPTLHHLLGSQAPGNQS